MPYNEKNTTGRFKGEVSSLFTRGCAEKEGALPPTAHFSIWYFLIAFLLIIYLQQYFFSKKVETIPYSQFKQNLVAGNVTKLIIGPEHINGTLKGKDKRAGEGLHHATGG